MAPDTRTPGQRFAWLWAAFAVSTLGTWLAFDAFPLIAIRVLHADATQVALLAATGPAVGALAAVPLGPWVEFRRKRPVMIAADLLRCAALLTIPLAHLLGRLTLAQLALVSVLVSAADIAFRAASGAFLKGLIPAGELLRANARLESTLWTSTVIGPPLGGAAVGLFGPVLTVVADAASYVLSALGLRGVGRHEPAPPRAAGRLRARDLPDGWRYILTHPGLRPLFLNQVLVGALIMATSPLLAVLMLGDLGFAPWQYGLAFGVPCVGGLIGARLSGPLVRRHGRERVLRVAGTLRACWPLGLAFVRPGVAGLVLVLTLQLGMLICIGVFNPVYATVRLELTATERVARTLSAWSVTSNATIAGLTAAWGALSSLTGPRIAVAVAGGLLLTTPLLLPRGGVSVSPAREELPSAG